MPHAFAPQVRYAAESLARARTFLNRASWALATVLGAMAVSLWIIPFARSAGRSRLAQVLGAALLIEFVALIGFVVILWRRFRVQLDIVAEDHTVLTALNGRLVEQHAALEHQTQLLQDQAMMLETQAAELKEHAADLEQTNQRLLETVHDRDRLEIRLRQSQKMDALGQLAGGVAHDFNNLLTIIEGYTGLLLTGRSIANADRPHIEEIRDAARRAASLTRQLLAFSRQQVLRPHVFDLNAAIVSVASMLRRLIGEHIELRTNLAPDLRRVRADRGQIEQVLMNLVVNARDAMPDGGHLAIETANVVIDTAEGLPFPVKQPGTYVMLAVTDTGTGIARDELHRVFDPFYTTKENGTGLGLATVHGIVEQSGGHVWVYSEVGQGATFKVYLPAHDDETAEPDVAPDAPQSQGVETILLVEDDDGLRRIASAILQRAGYTVLETANGADALRLCEDSSRHIDLVVSDMVMPRMGGRALVDRVRQLRPGVPILLMSGYTRDSLARTSELPAQAAFIEKPFTPEELRKKVRDLLDAVPPRQLPSS